jgi:hypothetical protein
MNVQEGRRLFCPECWYVRQPGEAAFVFLGDGFVRCPVCGSLLVTTINGGLALVERRAANVQGKNSPASPAGNKGAGQALKRA